MSDITAYFQNSAFDTKLLICYVAISLENLTDGFTIRGQTQWDGLENLHLEH